MTGTIQLDGTVYTPLFVSTFNNFPLIIKTLAPQLGVSYDQLQINSVTQVGDNVVISYSIRAPGSQVPQVQSNLNNLKLADIFVAYPIVAGLSVGTTSVTVAPPAPPMPPSPPPSPPAPPHVANQSTLRMVFYIVLGVSVGAIVVGGVIGCVLCWPRRMKRTRARRTHKDELQEELLRI